MRKQLIILITTTSLLITTNVFATRIVKKCTGSDGSITYATTCPAGTFEEVITNRSMGREFNRPIDRSISSLWSRINNSTKNGASHDSGNSNTNTRTVITKHKSTETSTLRTDRSSSGRSGRSSGSTPTQLTRTVKKCTGSDGSITYATTCPAATFDKVIINRSIGRQFNRPTDRSISSLWRRINDSTKNGASHDSDNSNTDTRTVSTKDKSTETSTSRTDRSSSGRSGRSSGSTGDSTDTSQSFNVTDYGASPSASPSANVAAFQRAVDAATKVKGKVFVPAGKYTINHTIWMRDHVTLEGEGSTSHINNIAVGKTNGIPALMLGNYPGRTFNDHTYYSIQAANKNDTVIRFKNGAHASNFKVGDIAAFRSQEGFRGDDRPKFQELNEVVAVGNGTITLKYPLHDRLAGANPKVARSGERAVVIRGEPAKVVKQATVRNLKISSINQWVGLGGCFECLVENLELDGRDLFAVNAFARSTMRNIKAKYNFNFLHIAYFSHHSLFENIEGTYDGPGDDDAGIDVGEAAHHLQFKNIKLNSTGRWRKRGLVSFGNSSFNRVEGLRATLAHAPTIGLIEFRGGQFRAVGNVVKDSVITYDGSLAPDNEIVRFKGTSDNIVTNATINSRQAWWRS